ncbi:MAG: hypothetical protein KKD39_08250 [Candidatus Altiarchaeota archaeon]|nr:hypothetical protein [Candidatus Altiarchaeota archaeon]
MITVNSLIGKTVVDGSGLGIAFVDGFNVTLPDNRVYLRLAGEKLLSIRGRKTEFIPVSEIDLIEENIKLFRDFTSISETVKSVNMESMETYLIKELLGKELLSLDDLKVGGCGRRASKERQSFTGTGY